MKHFLLLGLLAFALAAGTGFGCYTMIRHPEIDPSESAMHTDQVGDTSCADCHADADYYHWTSPYYTSFYSDYPSTWGTYYLNPWWHDKYWAPGSGGSGEPVERDGRHAWDRGPGAPRVPSVGGSQSTISTGKPAAAPQDTASGRNNRPEKEQPREKEEKKRNAWGR